VGEVSARNFDKARRGLLTQSDLDSQIMSLRLLRSHFREVGFDTGLKQAMASRHITPTDLRTFSNPDIVVSAMSKYGVQVTPDEVRENLARLLPPDDATLNADFARLRIDGLDSAFSGIEGLFEHAKEYVPAADGSLSRSEAVRRIMALPCPALLTFSNTAFGVAIGSLAPGCFPEPFFVVICPAIGVLGIVATLVGIGVWIACG